jgi:hypothetical protein
LIFPVLCGLAAVVAPIPAMFGPVAVINLTVVIGIGRVFEEFLGQVDGIV